MIEVIFYKGPETLFGKLIRLWTRSPYSHCEIHFGNGFCFTAHPDRGTTWFSRRTDDGNWDAIHVPGVDMHAAKMFRFCDDELGCKYDWRGIIFTQVLPWGWQSNSRWFCSEICVAILQQAGVLMHLKPHRVSPAKLFRELQKLQP